MAQEVAGRRNQSYYRLRCWSEAGCQRPIRSACSGLVSLGSLAFFEKAQLGTLLIRTPDEVGRLSPMSPLWQS